MLSKKGAKAYKMPTVVNFFNLSPQKLDAAFDWQITFAKRYKENGCSLTWLVFHSQFDNKFGAFRQEGLNVEFVPTESTEKFKLVLFLLRFIIKKRVDVFSMNFIRPLNAIALIILSKVLFQKTIFIYHMHSPGRLIKQRFNIKRYINPLSMLSLFVDKIVCNSDSIIENCINRGVKRDKVTTIYNGISIERFERAHNNGLLRKEFNIPADYTIISAIKDARPEVGLKDLLYSIPSVLSVFPKTIFLIVGGGMETEKLITLAKKLNVENNVIFAGIRNDVPTIIAESYFTIDPSPVEAFGSVIIESMAGRKPVIAVNAWGPKEIIVHEITGILVPPGKPTNFAHAIIELMSSPEKVKMMGEKSLERAKESFSVELMVNRTVNLYLGYLDSQMRS